MLVQDELARPIIAAMKAFDDRLRTASGRERPSRFRVRDGCRINLAIARSASRCHPS